MPADTPHPDDHRDPRDGTAPVAPVTDAMMDHAAHEAAALADGVAHGTIAAGRTPEAATGEAAPAAATALHRTVETASAVSDATAEAARHVVGTAVAAVDATAERTAALADAVTEGAGRVAEQARDTLSASADALAQYNAKVFEMLREGAASTTALFAALVQAKSVPEALSINADHMRRRMETLTSQGRELATLAQTIALDALQPLKGRPER